SKGLAAGGTTITLFLVGVNLDVALVHLATGRAVGVATEYGAGVHGESPSGCDGRRFPLGSVRGPLLATPVPFHNSPRCYLEAPERVNGPAERLRRYLGRKQPVRCQPEGGIGDEAGPILGAQPRQPAHGVFLELDSVAPVSPVMPKDVP